MKEENLLSEALAHLPDGFQMQYELHSRRDTPWSDGTVWLHGPHGVAQFVLAVKLIHRKESLMTVRTQLAHLPTDASVLLVCNRLTPALAKYCATHQINFLDTAGNARIQSTGLYLSIEGRYQSKPMVINNRFPEGVMKLLFVLLSCPERLNDTYRNLAEQAGISLGMVSKAFTYLEAQRYLRKSQKKWRLINEAALQIVWIKNYATALQLKMDHLLLAKPVSWDEITLTAGEYWGGEIAAAALLEGYLVPESGIIFTPYPLLQRRKEMELKPVSDGQLRLFARFWGKFILNRKAEAILCIAELLASHDDRSWEAARMINEKYLHLNESALFSY